MPLWPGLRRLSPPATAVVVAAALVAVAGAAERAGRERYPTIDAVVGISIGVAGAVTVAVGAVGSGCLLIAAELVWFAATARLGGDALLFVHRSFVVHAFVVAIAFRAGGNARRGERLAAWVVIAIAYVASIGGERALSAPWTLAVAVGVIGVVMVDATRRHELSVAPVLGVVGTVVWTAAATIARTGDWFDVPTRLSFYGGGLVAVALAVALAAGGERSRRSVTHRDLVRDDGRGSVRVGFSATAGFEDVRGEPFAARPGEAMTVFELGAPLGQVVLAHGTPTLDASADSPGLMAGLRLLAANHGAVRALRAQAEEIAASARRLELADALAAGQLGSELEQMVVTRIDAATAILADGPTPVAEQARVDLRAIVDDVRVLASGLGPAALAEGLESALRGLADGRLVRVSYGIEASQRVEGPVATVIYFTAAECVANAVRHAAATAVTVTLGADSDELHLTVADDGIGGVIRGVDDGHGLQGLWTRVEELGGRFEMRSAPGRGTIVAVSLPRRADRRPVS